MTSSKKSFEEDGPEGSEEVKPGDDLGASQVQAISDEAAEKGYYGEVPDETPNENYTLKGVTSGKPTPETELGK